jgi:DNA-binding MarR family transcriptional regulator
MDETEDPGRPDRVLRAAGALVRRVRTEAQGITGLTLAQESLVALLLESHDGLSSAELARAEGVRAQTMSTAVAALEKKGILYGVPDPSDGRRTILRVSAEGERVFGSSRVVKRQWLRDSLAGLSDGELRDLDRGLSLLQRIAES